MQPSWRLRRSKRLTLLREQANRRRCAQRLRLSKPIRLRLTGTFQRSNSDKLVHHLPEYLTGTLNGRCITFKRLGIGAHRAVYGSASYPRIVFKFTTKQENNTLEAAMGRRFPDFVNRSFQHLGARIHLGPRDCLLNVMTAEKATPLADVLWGLPESLSKDWLVWSVLRGIAEAARAGVVPRDTGINNIGLLKRKQMFKVVFLDTGNWYSDEGRRNLFPPKRFIHGFYDLIRYLYGESWKDSEAASIAVDMWHDATKIANHCKAKLQCLDTALPADHLG